MRRPVVVLVIAAMTLISASAGLAACGSGSEGGGATSTSAVPQPSTSTTLAPATTLAPTTIPPTTLPPNTSTAPVETSATLAPVTELDSWHGLPLVEGARNILAGDSELQYVVEMRSDDAYDFYMGAMEQLGYKVVSDAPSAPIHMTIYEKDGTRYTMFIVPPNGGDGSELEAYIAVKQD